MEKYKDHLFLFVIFLIALLLIRNSMFNNFWSLKKRLNSDNVRRMKSTPVLCGQGNDSLECYSCENGWSNYNGKIRCNSTAVYMH